MRRVSCSLVLLLVLVGCGTTDRGSTGQTGSNASCVAPYLDNQPPNGQYGTRPPTVRPGTSIKIYGHWYTTTCNDTGVNGAPANDPRRPVSPVRLTLTLPGGRVRHLGTVTPAGPDRGFAVSVHVPRSAGSGTATISDDGAHPSTYSFTVG